MMPNVQGEGLAACGESPRPKGWGALRSRFGSKNRRAEHERCTLNETVFYDINADEFDITRPFWKSASDIFMVYDNIAHNSTADEFGVNVRLTHARGSTSANLSMTGGE